jgi:hypothetical protein
MEQNSPIGNVQHGAGIQFGWLRKLNEELDWRGRRVPLYCCYTSIHKNF